MAGIFQEGMVINMLPRVTHLKLFLAWLVFVALILISPQTSRAGAQEMALFFDELVSYGDWVDYQQYGPVWFPTKVDEGWRPYLDGRWVPTVKGWVFETEEPWGWATYHFGNWLVTREYGWVWVPGSTWYASTATWRRSEEKGKEAIGWAPVPPPSYEPEPEFVPPGGFPPETPVQVQIIPAMFIFAPGAVFLQGLGQPYAPEYSYQNCGELVPPEQVPQLFPLTALINNFVAEANNPEAVADWGPSLDEVAETCGASPAAMVQSVNYYSAGANTVVHNYFPPRGVFERRGYLKHLYPIPGARVNPLYQHGGKWGHGESGGHHGKDLKLWGKVNNPHLTKLPPNMPPPPKNFPPKTPFTKLAAHNPVPGKPPGFLGLPPKATAAGGLHKAGKTATLAGAKAPSHPPGAPAAAGPKGVLPAPGGRRAQLAQERAQMEKQAKFEGGAKAMEPGKTVPKAATERKPISGGASPPPVTKPRPVPKTPAAANAATPPGLRPASATAQGKPIPAGPRVKPPLPSQAKPQSPTQGPKTAEQFRQEREAKQQAVLEQRRQEQRKTGMAVGGPQGSPAGIGAPPAGKGMAASHPPPAGVGPRPPAGAGGPRPPKGYGSPPPGGQGGQKPGGFGLRPGGGPGRGPGVGASRGPVAGGPHLGGGGGMKMPATVHKGGGGGKAHPPQQPKKK